ncbi:MAG: class 1 fructose-bisphosphatase [Deltaproteobacteria bacterium]|jgi:fructose-1,6-bisphosphatase I|nr:class 1 fructose-bisphosphatase [Deltaproteobacteria bacterium]MBW2531645.1 class 1 fructose-bisphosphatase [Deltaproteobacteria bacterium]
MSIHEPDSSGPSRIGLTLETYILEGMLGRPHATGTFTSLLNQVALAAKLITSRVRRAGLADVLGYTGSVNVQGERVKKLDQVANDTMIQVLRRRHHCAAIASEEEESIRLLTDDRGARYLLLFDPLDGSSNIEVNVSIGTIFGILRKQDDAPTSEQHFLRPGREQVAAGYVIYGSSTMLVLTTGDGVHGFTYDPTVGEFFLSHENLRVPPRGRIYAINEANEAHWFPATKAWVDELKRPNPDGTRGRSMRWVGTLVADAHRTLLQGGVFAYPEDRHNSAGRLRLLYEANPFALLFEAAGGAASTGRGRVLDVEPQAIHDRTPLILGSKEDVAEAERILTGG